MVENANVGMRRRSFARVDLGADQVERPLEPRDLQERKVVGGIGVAPIKLLADDLLDPAEAEVFRSRNGAHRLSAHEAGEDSLRALMLFGQEGVGVWARAGMAVSFGETGSIAQILKIRNNLSQKYVLHRRF